MKASEYRETAKEADEQEALFQWAEANQGRLPGIERMYHVPNGEKRDKATAAKLKRMGVKSGVPDIKLPVVRSGFAGMYIEMKRIKDGVLSGVQSDWIEYLMREGYLVVVCKGWNDAARQIEMYMTVKIRRGA